MREIEILVELKETLPQVLDKLSGLPARGVKRTIDTYFFDPLRNNLKADEHGKLMECCRLREKSGKCFVTYKKDHYNGNIWSYSDEYETEIADMKALEKVFDCLGLQKLVTVDNLKHTFETTDYEIVVEEVKDLGCFLEVEALHDNEATPVQDIKEKIWAFIRDLGLQTGAELNSGKPELLLNKKMY